MINNIGYVFLAAALAVSLYGVVVPHLGVVRNNWNLVRSAQFATILNLLLVLGASAVLMRGFLMDDFSIRFVWQNSSTDLPLGYKIAAFWGGMDGSLLFWELVLAGFAAVVAYSYQRSNREIIPYVIVVLNIIQVFLLFLLTTYSNPLGLQAPIPLEGRGLNPLLQHPSMAAHPPLLYLGYIGFSVPFAFAIASLIRGKLDNAWVVTTRRWTLFAWYSLIVGQMLGGQWAYEELGWGGYWGWDPVENAALMPWLTGTAFLHSIMLQEKRNMMKVWNVALIIITFSLSILGTFIVRSGVLNSVHAFAQSEIGPAFLIFIALVMVASFYLMFLRIKLLESRHTAERLLSKESTFLLNNLFLVGIAFTVFLGTVFPLIAEAVRGTKLSIQAPFFNTIIGPLGVALLALLGLCTLIAWRHSNARALLRNLRLPLGVAVAAAALMALLGLRHPGALLVFSIAAFTSTVLVSDYLRSVLARARQQRQSLLSAAGDTIMRNQQRFGGLVIHLGVVFLFVGLTGNLLNSERILTLTLNQPVRVEHYTLLFKGMKEEQVRNARLRAAEIEVYRDGEFLETLRPARSFYPTQPDPLTEVAIRRTLAEDLYLVLASENAGGTVTIRARINPLVIWAWFAFPLFSVGVVAALLYRPRRLEAPETPKGLGYA
ncbi:MAG: heme lyase CcmF/NrfE family subunit [SAR324 cluster bacterium]|nr:heme lyase CcmF/NrfE family subunit [SAR324 cluster bacterium]MCZ6628143.1 heme lyase CcmF/NrfE family subunit [SAR324 cluster bacterium]